MQGRASLLTLRSLETTPNTLSYAEQSFAALTNLVFHQKYCLPHEKFVRQQLVNHLFFTTDLFLNKLLVFKGFCSSESYYINT